MRHISGRPVFIFTILTLLSLAIGLTFFYYTNSWGWPSWLSALALLLGFFCGLILFYRLWLHLRPTLPGPIAVGSSNELNYQVNILFWLVFFNALIVPCWVPVPLSRLMYRMFGAKIGPRSYSGGVIYDPHFVEIGADSLIGAKASLIPHFSQGQRLEHHKIKVGNRVTIGTMSVVLAGCHLEDGAILGALSLLPKNSRVGSNELWAGNPAVFLRHRSVEDI